jgi:hypothetical protein
MLYLHVLDDNLLIGRAKGVMKCERVAATYEHFRILHFYNLDNNVECTRFTALGDGRRRRSKKPRSDKETCAR